MTKVRVGGQFKSGKGSGDVSSLPPEYQMKMLSLPVAAVITMCAGANIN